MKIHFVCTSNTFRSRMADTYLKSKKITGLSVSSSGIEAKDGPNGPITWYAQRIIQRNNLISFEPPSWAQTTGDILKEQDFVIFMEKWHYEASIKRFGYIPGNFEIWDIEDLNGKPGETDVSKMQRSEEIYNKIANKIDDMILKLYK